MAKVNISSYIGDVVGGNWTPAFNAAHTAIKANGGTIYLDQQTVKLATSTAMTPDVNYTVPLIIAGDGSSRIQLDGGSTQSAIYGGSHAYLGLRDFVMHGTDPENSAYVDTGIAVSAISNRWTQIDNVIFAGIKADNCVVLCQANWACLAIRNSRFGGCVAPSIIKMDGGNYLVVENTEFFDYEAIQNIYYSKTPAGASYWINAINPQTQNGATDSKVSVRNCRFDEGAVNAVRVAGYPHVEILQCAINNNSGGGAINLDGVGHAVIRQVTSGYTNFDMPAVQLTNCGDVLIDGLFVDHGVVRVTADKATRLTVKNSPGVKVVRT